MIRKQTAPRPFNQMAFQRKYEVMPSGRLRTEVTKFKRELDQLKRLPRNQQDKFHGERLRVAFQKVKFVEEMLKQVIRDERTRR